MASEENLILYIILGVTLFMIIVQPPLNDYDDDGEPTREPTSHAYFFRALLLIIIFSTAIKMVM